VGVGLYYQTTRPAPADAAVVIRREVSAASAGQPWIFCEPPCIFDDEGDGILQGGTKLNLHPWPDEHREAMRHPPGRTDLQVVLDLLTDWSARFDLTWELTIDGAPLGRIESGDCPPDLSEALEALAAVAGELAHFDPTTGGRVADDPDEPGAFDDPPDDRPPPTGPRLYRS
jgi:hypothetical protein